MKGASGVVLDEKLKDASISKTTAIKRRPNEVLYHLFTMKDKDYVIKLMATYSLLNTQNNQGNLVQYIQIEKSKRQWVTLKYTENLSNNYERRHVVENHNHSHYQVPLIKRT